VKQLLYICIFLLLVIESQAAPAWFQGSIVLSNEKVLVGEISVEEKYDVVLLRNQDRIVVYPAHKVQSVWLYDASSDMNRKFISIKNSSTAFHAYQLYEVVILGEITLLRKEISDVAATEEEHDALGYRYLVQYKGELSSLKKFRTAIYPKIKDMPGVEMHTYIKMNKLNPNNESNVVRIIQHYNQMIATVGDLAMN
jgi:hypothetical protein